MEARGIVTRVALRSDGTLELKINVITQQNDWLGKQVIVSEQKD